MYISGVITRGSQGDFNTTIVASLTYVSYSYSLIDYFGNYWFFKIKQLVEMYRQIQTNSCNVVTSDSQ